MTSAIIIHGLDDARAALQAARELRQPVTVISAPGGGSYAGPGWFNAVIARARGEFPDVPVTAILDCDDAPGHVLGALRAGVKAVRFTGRADVAAKLAEIAAALDAAVITNDIETLDLRAHRDPVAACKAWLSGHVAA
jgi:fructose/tagatose bisphosphate aldolase